MMEFIPTESRMLMIIGTAVVGLLLYSVPQLSFVCKENGTTVLISTACVPKIIKSCVLSQSQNNFQNFVAVQAELSKMVTM